MTGTRAPGGPRAARAARRACLLLAARDVFAEHGYHATSMGDIAEHAGFRSKPMLYQHFPGKFELYQALLSTYTEQLVGRVAAAIADTGASNEQRVQAAGAAYFEFVAGEGRSYRLVFGSDLRGDPEVAAVAQGALDRCIDTIADAVTTDAGLDRDRARLLAVGLVGLSQVGAQYWLDTEQGLPREQAVALMSALAWKGIAGFPRITD